MRTLSALFAVAALALVGCGGDDGGGKITDQSECEDTLKDYLIDEYEAGNFNAPSVNSADEQDFLAAVDDTLPEFCNEIELREGVELDEIDSRAKAYLQRQMVGIGIGL